MEIETSLLKNFTNGDDPLKQWRLNGQCLAVRNQIGAVMVKRSKVWVAVRTDPWRGCGSRYMGPQRSKRNGQPTWTLLSLHNEKKSRMDDQRLKPDTAKNTHDSFSSFWIWTTFQTHWATERSGFQWEGFSKCIYGNNLSNTTIDPVVAVQSLSHIWLFVTP